MEAFSLYHSSNSSFQEIGGLSQSESQAVMCWRDKTHSSEHSPHTEEEDVSCWTDLPTGLRRYVDICIGILGAEKSDEQIFVSFCRKPRLTELTIEKFQDNGWHQVDAKDTKRLYFSTAIKIDNNRITLMENECRENGDDVIYIAEIKTTPTNPQPETPLAKLWNECLGPYPIPFDTEARKKLIDRGRLHPELNRHIEAWEKMQGTSSKWVYGDKKDER